LAINRWAFIRNEEVYQRMNTFLQLNTMGVSRDTQLRAMKLLKVIVEDGGREIFKFGYKTMTKRWDRLRKTLSMSNRFSLQKVAPENCTYFQKVREPTPGENLPQPYNLFTTGGTNVIR